MTSRSLQIQSDAPGRAGSVWGPGASVWGRSYQCGYYARQRRSALRPIAALRDADRCSRTPPYIRWKRWLPSWCSFSKRRSWHHHRAASRGTPRCLVFPCADDTTGPQQRSGRPPALALLSGSLAIGEPAARQPARHYFLNRVVQLSIRAASSSSSSSSASGRWESELHVNTVSVRP